MAWCAQIDGSAARVVGGSRVEAGTDFVVEGAWAGPFADGPIPGSFHCGTAIRTAGHHLRLWTTSSPIDRIAVVRDGARAWISNSLAFALAASGRSLDPAAWWIRSLVLGIESSARSTSVLPLRGGGQVEVLWRGEAILTLPGGPLVPVPTPAPCSFSDFAAYRDHLTATTRELLANALDPSRERPLAPLLTLSSGFDSTAASAVCSSLGVTDALTMVRSHGDVRIDDARRAAQALGLELREVDRRRWRTAPEWADAELAASGVALSDAPFRAMEAEVSGRLVVGGHNGDDVWALVNRRSYRDSLVGFGRYEGRGLCEWRLRAGCVVLPLPMIASSAHRSIERISQSDEMRPWRLGVPYDRPIPRRIAEEAGVPRGAFGHHKFGLSGRGARWQRFVGTDPRQRHEELRAVGFRAASADSYLAYLEANDLEVELPMRIASHGARLFARAEALNVRTSKVRETGRLRVVPRALLETVPVPARVPVDHSAWLPHWGTEVLRGHYDHVAWSRRPTAAADAAVAQVVA